MTLMRMPMFVWAVLVTQVLVLLAFPVITVALILLLADRIFGTPASSRTPWPRATRCSGSTSSGSSATPRCTS